MDPFEFRQFSLVFCDFCTGLDHWDTRSLEGETLQRWTPLYTTVKSHKWGTQDEIVSVTMSEILHKLMMIVCANHGVREVSSSCPGWLWLIMELDTQLDKRAAPTPAPANTMAAMRAMLHDP
jgi:hypothetical protein